MLLNIEQIAERLGLSIKQVRKQINGGRLIIGDHQIPLLRLGGKRGRLYCKAVDLEWLATPSNNTPPEVSHKPKLTTNPKVADFLKRMAN